MKKTKPDIRELFAALLRLNDISQGKASDLAGLVRQNVSSWCTGRDNAISQKSQFKLLATLGVSYGSLRSEGVHRWCVNDVGDAALVLDAALNDEERAQAEFWHVHNLLYPGCIVLKITKQAGLIWVMMYRPLMAEPPQPINAESLRCGVDRGEVIIDSATWESWLPPAVLEPISFGTQINSLIDQFPYPNPSHQYFDDMEMPEGQNLIEENQDQIMERLAPTAEELKKWDEVLFQAKVGGKSFDEIIKETRKVLGIRILGQSA